MRAPAPTDNFVEDGLYTGSDREDFSDYLWMEDVESFDKQVLAELQEEEEMEQCMEEMLAEEEARDTTYYVFDEPNSSFPILPYPSFRSFLSFLNAPDDFSADTQDDEEAEIAEESSSSRSEPNNTAVFRSELNPDAAEFVPNVASTYKQPVAKTSTSSENPDR